eukprot:CAMPEP_0197921634 /NCGR_PEP_ID=MMETSP1439-20131203/90985_1 /TAXON_ID=66791 /ORGANISM="Gonyaulax spinifera, Strain CCMP409" /LENGTH=125 /DNA_ID=CAMNT_0043543889 /DNA_START=1 /DNA_END=376 /DNA_ORIENTATION=-
MVARGSRDKGCWMLWSCRRIPQKQLLPELFGACDGKARMENTPPAVWLAGLGATLGAAADHLNPLASTAENRPRRGAPSRNCAQERSAQPQQQLPRSSSGPMHAGKKQPHGGSCGDSWWRGWHQN